MSVQGFAMQFVIRNQEQIKADLDIKYLDIDGTIETVCECIENTKIIPATEEQINDLIIKYLQCAKENGAPLSLSADEYVKVLEEKLHDKHFV